MADDFFCMCTMEAGTGALLPFFMQRIRSSKLLFASIDLDFASTPLRASAPLFSVVAAQALFFLTRRSPLSISRSRLGVLVDLWKAELEKS